MIKRLSLILIINAMIILVLNAQNDSIQNNTIRKGSPVVQVFFTTYYNPQPEKIGFSIGRAHLGYQYRFDDHFFAKIVLDRGRPGRLGPISVSDSLGNQYQVDNSFHEGSFYTMTLKFAFLEWKVNKKLKFQGGSILQNHYITQERFWGYRFIAKTFIDRYYLIPSCDLGFISFYKFNDRYGFDLAVTNGEGFRFDQDHFGKLKIAGGLNLNFIKGLQLRLYYHNMMSGDSINNANEQLFSLFTGYKHKKFFRIGFEFNYMKDFHHIVNFNTYGMSVYGSCMIFKKTEVFFRYDILQYDKAINTESLNGYLNGNAIITGISYHPLKGVKVALNYQGWYTSSSSDINILALSFEYKI